MSHQGDIQTGEALWLEGAGPTREKLQIDQEPKVVDDPQGRGKMLVPKPLNVDAFIRKTQEGKLANIGQIREPLAEDFHVDFTCPMTTGIFVLIAAPYWVGADGWKREYGPQVMRRWRRSVSEPGDEGKRAM